MMFRRALLGLVAVDEPPIDLAKVKTAEEGLEMEPKNLFIGELLRFAQIRVFHAGSVPLLRELSEGWSRIGPHAGPLVECVEEFRNLACCHCLLGELEKLAMRPKRIELVRR